MIDHARELGEPDDALDREIGDVRAADDRHHVVLAVRIEGDVAHHDHVVEGADLAEGTVEHLVGVFLVAAEELFVGSDHSLGRILEALAVRVFADPRQKRADRGLGLLARRPACVRGLGRGISPLLERRNNSVHILSLRSTSRGRCRGWSVTGYPFFSARLRVVVCPLRGVMAACP